MIGTSLYYKPISIEIYIKLDKFAALFPKIVMSIFARNSGRKKLKYLCAKAGLKSEDFTPRASTDIFPYCDYPY